MYRFIYNTDYRTTVTINKTYIMHIACSIYVLFALSFLCTVSAEESGGDKDVNKLVEKVKKNSKIINSLDTKVTNLDHGNAARDHKVEDLNGDLIGAVVEFDAQVTNLNEEIADLGGQLNTATDDLEGKIKFLEEALEEALKVEEIQFSAVASQASLPYPKHGPINCIDGRQTGHCHTDGWWKLRFTNDVVITRIVIYSEARMNYTAGNRVTILSAYGNIMWKHTIEKEDKPVYVIAVPNVVGRYVKIDKAVNTYIIMREVVVFGRYD